MQTRRRRSRAERAVTRLGQGADGHDRERENWTRRASALLQGRRGARAVLFYPRKPQHNFLTERPRATGSSTPGVILEDAIVVAILSWGRARDVPASRCASPRRRRPATRWASRPGGTATPTRAEAPAGAEHYQKQLYYDTVVAEPHSAHDRRGRHRPRGRQRRPFGPGTPRGRVVKGLAALTRREGEDPLAQTSNRSSALGDRMPTPRLRDRGRVTDRAFAATRSRGDGRDGSRAQMQRSRRVQLLGVDLLLRQDPPHARCGSSPGRARSVRGHPNVAPRSRLRGSPSATAGGSTDAPFEEGPARPVTCCATRRARVGATLTARSPHARSTDPAAVARVRRARALRATTPRAGGGLGRLPSDRRVSPEASAGRIEIAASASGPALVQTAGSPSTSMRARRTGATERPAGTMFSPLGAPWRTGPAAANAPDRAAREPRRRADSSWPWTSPGVRWPPSRLQLSAEKQGRGDSRPGRRTLRPDGRTLTVT